jgi:mannose-6-phosphate isomerase-like protein (cupin superfamily)
MRNGVDITFLAKGVDTDGEFGLYRWDVAEEAVLAPPHFHKVISESFFIIEGTMTIIGDGVESKLGPGGFHFVQREGLHGFRNDHGPVSMLILFTPGTPREDFFALLAERAAGTLQPTAEEWLDLCAPHDQYYR